MLLVVAVAALPATQVVPASTQTVTPQVHSKSGVPVSGHKKDAVEHKAAPESVSSSALPTLTVTAKQTETSAALEHAGTVTVNQTETVTPEARANGKAKETAASVVGASSVSSESATMRHITFALVAASEPESSSSAASSTGVPSASVQAAKADIPKQVSSASTLQQEAQCLASEAAKVQNGVPGTPFPASHVSVLDRPASTSVLAPAQSVQLQSVHSAAPPAQTLAPASERLHPANAVLPQPPNSEIPATQRLHPNESSVPSEQSHSVVMSVSRVRCNWGGIGVNICIYLLCSLQL